jgi:hypothetical protein
MSVKEDFVKIIYFFYNPIKNIKYLKSFQSLHNPGTGSVATDPAFTCKSTQFLFRAPRDGGKRWYELSSSNK